MLFSMLIGGLMIYSTAKAEAPSFTYLELEFVASGDVEINDGNLTVDIGMDGYALNASAQLGIFLLQASRFELKSDEILGASINDSVSTLALGVVFKFPQTSVYGLVRGRRDELELSGRGLNQELDGNSVGLEAGVRINLSERFEINANIGSPALDEGTSFGVGAQFHVTKNLGVTLDFSSIEFEEEDIDASFDTTSIGLRYNF